MKSIKKYFPELFAVFCEDEYVGALIKKKEWLLDLVSLPPEPAIQKITAIKNFRKFLKTAKKIINQGNNKIDVKTLLMRFPLLSGKISEGMYKEDAIAQIEKFDSELKKEGWAIVLSNQLIQLPLNKFLSKLQITNSFYVKAKELVDKSSGKGSVAEASALKNLRKINQKKAHFENIIKQILLANPVYLRNLKSSKSWLSKTPLNPLDPLIKNLTPKSIKEQLWLREMREKLKE